MRILDIDLDVFVSPVARNKRSDDPRLPDSDYSIPTEEEVEELVRERWKIRKTTPIIAVEHHDQVIEVAEKLISRGTLKTPLRWIHIDAHDDFYGHYSKPVNAGNYMYEVVRRKWCDAIALVLPNDEPCSLPSYIYNEKNQCVEFEGNQVRIGFFDLDSFIPQSPPEFVFLCRSPAFTPRKADRLYDRILQLGSQMQIP